MHHHFFSLRIAAIVMVAAVVVASIDLWINGFVTVADPDRQLVAAVLRDGDGDRPMRPMAEGFWAGRARGDGSIVMRCENGAELPGPYITNGVVVRETVAPGACAAARRGR
ncbi:hypothetical protein COC42_10305 [Sphingomonas spermidinifaciens]|uniref:Uncharacterized protein n=1 Tax=Sphingomonas spermidinifaciens TaxID=1141889 RepID=A0A2A4AY89_9SPHN|nr:hypothetical protein [Sphingomonas spermidinifaciens]PCD01893.1 hypothetical protein COC42_10305 [Sphingomonas spermidinifaciens]